MQFQRNRFAEDMRRMWAPRWLGYQLSRVAPLFFRWRGSPSVNAAFKVSASLFAEAALVTVRALQACAGYLAERSSAVQGRASPFGALFSRGAGLAA